MNPALKLGILDTDTLAPDIEQQYGNYYDMFAQLLSQQNAELRFKRFHVIEDQWPTDINECDAYIISGSKFSAYDTDEWIERLKKLIAELYQQQIKMIGICFGHQIIAAALGGRVEKSDRGWGVGVCHYRLPARDIEITASIIDDEVISLLASHQDQVSQLPDQATITLESDHCPIAGFQIAQQVLTLQPHPEFSADYCRYLINKRRQLIGENKSQKALDSLAIETDHIWASHWILNFLLSD